MGDLLLKRGDLAVERVNLRLGVLQRSLKACDLVLGGVEVAAGRRKAIREFHFPLGGQFEVRGRRLGAGGALKRLLLDFGLERGDLVQRVVVEALVELDFGRETLDVVRLLLGRVVLRCLELVDRDAESVVFALQARMPRFGRLESRLGVGES